MRGAFFLWWYAVETWLLLAIFGIVLLAFFTESVVGFGATVITVSFGAHLVPLDVLLPAFVPLSAMLSLVLVTRHWREVDLKFLIQKVALPVGLGTLLGMGLFRVLDSAALLTTFAGFVLLMSGRELKRIWVRAEAAKPLKTWLGRTLLGAGGVVHGMFGSGGPMIVYVLGREMTEKGRFRATLSALWLVLNAALVTGYLLDGTLNPGTIELSTTMAPALFFGILLGERVHGAIDESTFKTATWLILFFGAAALFLRAL